MSDIPLLSAATALPAAFLQPIQETPISCENCVAAYENGLNLDAKSSFFEYFSISLDQLVRQESGKLLPKVGDIFPQTLLQLKSDKLQPLLKEAPDNYTSIESGLEQIHQKLDAELRLGLYDLLQPISSFAASNLNTLQNTLDIETQLADLATDSKGILYKDVDESNYYYLLPQQGINTQQQILDDITLDESIDLQKTPSALDNSFGLNQKTRYQFQDKVISSNEIQEKLLKEDYFDQAVEENIDFELFSQKQSINKETTYSALSTYKTSPNSQYINPILPHDSNQRVSMANPTSSTHDLASSILKQNIHDNFELINQNNEQSLNQNIKWLINNKIQNAKINLYPESLGHINVSLSLDDTKLTINFIASNITAREVIETNLSNLREQLNESGIDLKEATVSDYFLSDDNYAQNPEDNFLDSEKSTDIASLVNIEDVSGHEDIKRELHTSYLVDAYV